MVLPIWNVKKTGIGMDQYRSLTPVVVRSGVEGLGEEYFLNLANQYGPGTVIELFL